MAGCAVSGDEMFDVADCSDVALGETLFGTVDGKSLGIGEGLPGNKTPFTGLPWEVEFRLLVIFALVGLLNGSVFAVEFSFWISGHTFAVGSVAATLGFDTVATYSNVITPITNTKEFDLVDINNQSAALYK